MPFHLISELITQAKVQEQETKQLARQLEKMTNGLHSTIHISGEKKSAFSLTTFVLKYIEHAPKYLTIMVKASIEARMQPWILPVIKLTEDFFLHPPSVVGQEKSLTRLMESAYLAHRLIEEINDRYFLEAGQVLIPVDMTTANLIIHQLIGEPFSNQLDVLCVELANDLMTSRRKKIAQQTVGITPEKQRLWIQAWQHWSDVLDEKNVSIKL